MKHLIIRRTSILIGLTCICLVINSQLSQFTLQAAAQDPPATSTPTSTPTPTSTSSPTATSTPDITPTAGAPVQPPSYPTATPVRVVRFAVDDENEEIDEGECVLFSWVVRGDIAWVEFDEKDDDRDPILVSDIDERTECPIKDTDYQLKVTWLDDTTTKTQIEIEVRPNASSGSGSSGGSGSGDGSGSAPSPATGPFVAVTPILFQDITLAPSGVLETVNSLPETGNFRDNKVSNPVSHWPVWFMLAGGIGALLAGSVVIVGLNSFAKLRRES